MSTEKRRPKNPRRQDAMPQIISRIHWHDGMSRRELDKAITKELIKIWHSTWSERERQLRANIAAGQQDELSPGLMSKLDKIILRQAETLGWRLLISTRVLHRISMWETIENGSDLFVQLGKALATNVRIVRRRKLPPIDDPDLVSAQTQTTRELKFVLRKMKQEYSAMHRAPDAEKLSASFVRIVSGSSENLPSLSENLLRWIAFFMEDRAALKKHVMAKRLSPTALYLQWLSFCKGHDPETLRKMISSLGSTSRS